MYFFMSASRFTIAVAISSSLALAHIPKADARGNKGIGIGLGIAAGAILLNELSKGGGASASTNRSRPSKSTGGGGSKKAPSNDDDDDDEPAQKTVKTVPSKPTLTAQEEHELRERQAVAREDRQRDVDKHITMFIEVLNTRHWLRKVQQSKSLNDEVKLSSEVTEADVRRTLEDAYAIEKLGMFAKFDGEPWSKERLLVRVLSEAYDEVEPYFKGIASRGPNSGDVAQIMQVAARKVFAQVFEVSEMLGMVASHERLYREVSEVGSDEKAERYVEVLSGLTFDRAVTEILAAGVKSRPDGNPYAQKLRARRAVYDCVGTVATAIAAQPDPTSSTPPKQEQRADLLGGATIQKTSTGERTVTVVEEPPETPKPEASDRLISGDLKTFLIKSCGERIAKLAETSLMPIPAKAILDRQTRPIVDGQVWLISDDLDKRR